MMKGVGMPLLWKYTGVLQFGFGTKLLQSDVV